MVNVEALETFSNYDKKSLMAGVVVGQGLKGRARAPQNYTPAPAGFPQSLWDAANERANAVIASMQVEEQSGEPEQDTPDDWQFDKDAFCFGIAAGRSLEGWEIDGGLEFVSCSKIMYYIRLNAPCTVHVNVRYSVRYSIYEIPGKFFAVWGDDSRPDMIERDDVRTPETLNFSHDYQSGDYVITVISDRSIYPYGDNDYSSVYVDFDTEKDVEELHAVYFNDNIHAIGKYAFYRCVNLVSPALTNHIGRLESYAFYGCDSFVDITIPKRTSSDFNGTYVFTDCAALKSVTIESGTEPLRGWFMDCHALTSVTMPEATSIGAEAFRRCENLSNITTISDYADVEEPTPVVSHVGERAFSGCRNLKKIAICGSIYTRAFYLCENLADVTLMDGVERILPYAFACCYSLKSIIIPDCTTYLETECNFYMCTSLKSVVIGDGIISIPYWAFCGCSSLTNLTLGRGVHYISQQAFTWCPLPTVSIPISVNSMYYNSFLYCGLRDVYYEGTEEQLRAITSAGVDDGYFWSFHDRRDSSTGYYEFSLYHAAFHCNSTGPDDVHDN